MKTGPTFTEIIKKIHKMTPDLRGVFTFSDLWILTGSKSSDRAAKVISRLVREKMLFKIRRNIYVTEDADLWVLASTLNKRAYVSMDSVLARNGLIGTVPAYSVSLAYPGPPQTIKTPLGLLRFFKIQKGLIFGTERAQDGITVADSEKAYLDLLYFYAKGARFVIDPLTDVNLWRLDLKKLSKYLRFYKNPKFVAFVEGLIREES